MGMKRRSTPFAPRVWVLLSLVALHALVLLGRASGEAAPGTTEEQYLKALAAARRQHPDLLIPDDVSPVYLVRAVQIRGNTLLSVQELLGRLPVLYVEQSGDANVPAEGYDFRALQQVIRDPGELRQISMRTIRGLTKYLLSRYSDRGYAGIYAYVSVAVIKPSDSPALGAHRLENDILSLQIIEGKVAAVEAEHYDFDGNKSDEGYLKRSLVVGWSPAKRGSVIQKQKLDDFVRLLNQNPDRYVRHTVSTSTELNALDLKYAIYEGDPWHPYVQVDDSGTDERQWNPRIGLFNTNLTGHDDHASIMYQAQVDAPDENYAAFGSYGLPVLTPRLRLGIYGGYSQFDITPETTGGQISFLGDGFFFGANLRYNVLQVHDWFFDFTGSVSSEESKVGRRFGATNLGSEVDMRLFGLGFEIHRSDAASSTSVAFERIENYDGSSSSEFESARTGTDPDFAKYSVWARHNQFLDEAKIHHLGSSFRAVFADERLVPAKMTTFGGLYSVRGYEEDALVADGGILASLEYRWRLTGSPGQATPDQDDKSKKTWSTDVSLVGFTDYGQAQTKDPVPGELDDQDLWSVGLGTLVEVGDNFQVSIYHGWALREIVRPSDGHVLADSGDGQWHFSFLYRW